MQSHPLCVAPPRPQLPCCPCLPVLSSFERYCFRKGKARYQLRRQTVLVVYMSLKAGSGARHSTTQTLCRRSTDKDGPEYYLGRFPSRPPCRPCALYACDCLHTQQPACHTQGGRMLCPCINLAVHHATRLAFRALLTSAEPTDAPDVLALPLCFPIAAPEPPLDLLKPIVVRARGVIRPVLTIRFQMIHLFNFSEGPLCNERQHHLHPELLR